MADEKTGETADNPLELVATHELIAEVMRRSHATLIVQEVRPNVTDDVATTLFSYGGGLNAAIGLAERVKTALLRIGRKGIS